MNISEYTIWLTITMLIGLFCSPWVFLIVLVRDKRRQERLWRETLVYLKSASSYEAEDAIDRVERRQKTALQKRLAKTGNQSDTLSESPVGDMASDVRAELQKKYAEDDGSDA